MFKSRDLDFNKELAELFQKSSSTGNFHLYRAKSSKRGPEVNANTSLGFDDDDEEVSLASKYSTKIPISETASSTKEKSRGKKASKSTYKEDLYLEAATQACISKFNKYNAELTPIVDEYSAEKCMDALCWQMILMMTTCL